MRSDRYVHATEVVRAVSIITLPATVPLTLYAALVRVVGVLS